MSKAQSKLVAVDQILASSGSAAAVLVGALFLSTDHLNTYAISQLAVVVAVSLQRSLISEPAIALRGRCAAGDPTTTWLKYVTLALLLGSAGASLWVMIGSVRPLLVVSGGLPLIFDVLRYREIARGGTPALIVSDGLWLASVLTAFVLFSPERPQTAFFLWTITSLPSIALLGLKGVRLGGGGSLLETLSLGKYGFVDTMVAMVAANAPVFVINALVATSSAGAFRLSQTLAGPLNILAAMVIVRALVRSRQLHAAGNDALREESKRVGNRLFWVSLGYAVVLIPLMLIFSGFLDDLVRRQLMYALPITVVGAVVTSRAAVLVGMFRSLGEQRRGMFVRMRVLAVSLAALSLGLAVRRHGIDPLTIPMVAVPLATLFAWRAAFRRFLAAREG